MVGIVLAASGLYDMMKNIAPVSVRITKSGRVVIPAGYRHALGLKEGDEVLLSLVEGEVRLRRASMKLRRAQELVAKYAKTGEQWSDELIAERRAERHVSEWVLDASAVLVYLNQEPGWQTVEATYWLARVLSVPSTMLRL